LKMSTRFIVSNSFRFLGILPFIATRTEAAS
jgi:hypothetical protein